MTIGFSKTMKYVRFGDLAEPVGDAVRRYLRGSEETEVGEAGRFGVNLCVCRCSAVAPGPDKLWSSAVRFKQ